MSKVRDQMLTTAGRTLADERHAFMLTFFAQLSRETRVSLPL
jgi:HD superfamily phosphodiesterase